MKIAFRLLACAALCIPGMVLTFPLSLYIEFPLHWIWVGLSFSFVAVSFAINFWTFPQPK